MKTFGAPLQAHLDSRRTTMAIAIIIERPDGEILRITEHDRTVDIVASPGNGETFIGSAFDPSGVEDEVGMAITNYEIEGVISNPDLISEADLIARRYNGATLTPFLFNWANTSMETIPLQGFRIGQTIQTDVGWMFELRGIMAQYSQNILNAHTPMCRVRTLGAATAIPRPANGCRFKVDPAIWAALTVYAARAQFEESIGDVVAPSIENGFHYVCTTAGTSDAVEPIWPEVVGGTVVDGTVTWTARRSSLRTGEVAAVTSRRVFNVTNILGDLTPNTGGTLNGGWFAFGTVEFLDGMNEGIAIEIVSFEEDVSTSASPPEWTVTTFYPFPLDIAPGDQVVLRLGCDRLFETCSQLRANNYNFRAERNLPGQDKMLKIYKTKSSAGKK